MYSAIVNPYPLHWRKIKEHNLKGHLATPYIKQKANATTIRNKISNKLQELHLATPNMLPQAQTMTAPSTPNYWELQKSILFKVLAYYILSEKLEMTHICPPN
jgi:hypothetical protein